MSHQSECVSVCVCAHSGVPVFTAICECVDGFCISVHSRSAHEAHDEALFLFGIAQRLNLKSGSRQVLSFNVSLWSKC